MNEIRSPLQAQVVQWQVQAGEPFAAGALLLVLEAMKMEHEVCAPAAGILRELLCAPGDTVEEGALLARLDPAAPQATPAPTAGIAAPAGVSAPAARAPTPVAATAGIRPDLQRVIDRHAFALDAARPEAVAKRHRLGLRMARENIADLCDADSFLEYGALAVAAQSGRRSADDLMRNTPADGMVTGIGSINGALFGPQRSKAVVMAYDATVLAGTQGRRNHLKTDRMLGVALQSRLPVVLFAEGGGGRPGDSDGISVSGLHIPTWVALGRLNGLVPLVGIVAGRCFAGNAALLGCCDVIIATRDSNIGMGGPAMIEGGGLGVVTPEQVGPSAVQHGNGVIDILADDEAQAVRAARRYLSYFQGRLSDWIAPDPLALRQVVPENRLRVYDTRAALRGIADQDSVLELRTGFGVGIHTALARIEGRPVGVLANNPLHLGGAIDADAADKAARFLQLCSAHGLPVISLIDTPGFMVGPDIEEQAQVRHVSRMFVCASHLRVPCLSVVLRKGYGLGAMAMAAGSLHAPMATVAWPTGEFGGMGLEGYVRLGYRKELEAVPEGPDREALFQRLLQAKYDQGSAISMAGALEIDAVIDPAETRAWLGRALDASAHAPPAPLVPTIDAW